MCKNPVVVKGKRHQGSPFPTKTQALESGGPLAQQSSYIHFHVSGYVLKRTGRVGTV